MFKKYWKSGTKQRVAQRKIAKEFALQRVFLYYLKSLNLKGNSHDRLACL